MTLGERIRQARKKKGMTQKQLGEVSSTSETTVKQYERGVRQPRLDQLQRIAAALEVPVLYFTGEYPDIETAKEDMRRGKAERKILKNVYPIIEALYGKHETRLVEGQWMSMEVSVFGEGADAITIGEDDIEIITAAVEALTISLVENFKRPAEDRINEIREELSSDRTRDFVLGYTPDAPESTPPAREGTDTTPPTDAP